MGRFKVTLYVHYNDSFINKSNFVQRFSEFVVSNLRSIINIATRVHAVVEWNSSVVLMSNDSARFWSHVNEIG